MFDLLQRPELLSTLLANMQDGLSIVDPRGVQLYVNDALCRMLGFEAAELIGATPPYAYWPEDEIPALQAAFQSTLRGGAGSFELVFGRKDGSRVEVIVAPAELRDEKGTVLGYFATVKDISDRKQLERSLRASEERWRSVAENPFDFVVLIDRDYRYTYVNHTAPGISRETLVGRATPFDFVEPRYHDVMRSSFETTFATGRATSYEVYVSQLDAWYSSIVGAVVVDGRVTAVSILTREITEQKRAEETLRRSEQRLRESHKMETIGTLAGGIAHDINNMLTPILAYSDLARIDLPRDHVVQEYLEGIGAASQRARELVQRILLFSRRQEPRKSTFDLRQCVREDVTLLRASLPPNIELVIELPEAPVLVHADRAQMGQVLANLATNALQAMQERAGRLTLTVGPSDDPRFLSLTVADTGPGMDAEVMRRAFEPFFTTKAVGSGTGLGLSIVHSVVREHGGEVSVHSSPGAGATFTVRLPIASHDDQGIVERVANARTVNRVGLRILVVDDEPAIAKVAGHALRGAGHVVTALTSSREALELFKRDPYAFDALLTDQSMPDLIGTALIAEIRRIRPGMSCVLMTGLGDESTQRRAREVGALDVIAKPFLVATLLAALERSETSTVR